MSIRRKLMWWLYKHEANTIAVGASNHPTAETNPRAVLLTISGNPTATEVCLTPEGARLIGKQLNEWADFCEAANKEHAERQHQMTFKTVWKVVEDAAPVTGTEQVTEPRAENPH